MGELATIVGGGSVLALLTTAFAFFLSGARADRKELADERAERDKVEKELDAERALRRASEDREAKLSREVSRLSERVEHLSAEVAQLRAQLGAR